LFLSYHLANLLPSSVMCRSVMNKSSASNIGVSARTILSNSDSEDV
jgi:hypothetical protein